MSSMGESDWKEESSTPYGGVLGWKKRCLYVIILVLVSVITINLTLVCWLVTVLNLDTHGMNYIQSINNNGIQLTAKTYVEDLLKSSGLASTQPMSVRSVKNLSMRTTDRAGYPASSINLGSNKLDINTPNFTVTDPRGKTLFSVDEDAVSLTAHSLAISGEGGAVLEGSLQTPIVSADIRSDLVLESAMKAVQVVTPSGISIESRAGDIVVYGHQDINLHTVDGSIKLESANVLISGLKRLQNSHHHNKHHHRSDKIYQLCICDNGQLFLGEADAFCEAGSNVELCR